MKLFSPIQEHREGESERERERVGNREKKRVGTEGEDGTKNIKPHLTEIVNNLYQGKQILLDIYICIFTGQKIHQQSIKCLRVKLGSLC